METKDFRTKTEFIRRNNGNIPGVWEIALDIGYSAVKLFSPNITACFPSYAKRIEKDFQFMGKAPATSIIYKNIETGEMWLVGDVAQNIMKSGDTSDSDASLYGRERYSGAMFYVIAVTGLGIGMMSNQYRSYNNGDKLIVQTGLPERYMNDEFELKDALSGHHHFALSIGGSAWMEYDFNLNMENIYVMSQPKGTLFSVCIDKNGKWHEDAAKYLRSSIIVFDAGFGTLDLFPILAGTVDNGETYSDLGMKRVLQETSSAIYGTYGVEVPVAAMQKYLESGTIKYFNKKTFESSEHDFSNLLEKANFDVCNEAITRMAGALNLGDYDYIIITGGTGAAWMNIIKDKFKNLSTITLINGNENDDLSFIYSNVRGYYLYRYNKLGKDINK